MLPNFLDIGTGRAGTTTLSSILRGHPEIYMPKGECHFFQKGISEIDVVRYEQQFFSSCSPQHKAIGEKTPAYLFQDEAPKLIKNFLGGGVKFIVHLRHPVQRAYSHYLHNIRMLFEDRSFIKSVSVTEIASVLDVKDKGKSFLETNYLRGSIYTDRVTEFLKYFPRENFMFLVFERDIQQNLAITIPKILDFIGVTTRFEFNAHTKEGPTAKPIVQYFEQATKLNVVQLDGRTVEYKVPANTIVMFTGRIKSDKFIVNPSEHAKTVLFKIGKNATENLTPEFTQLLMGKYFLQDISALEEILDIDLSIWRNM